MEKNQELFPTDLLGSMQLILFYCLYKQFPNPPPVIYVSEIWPTQSRMSEPVTRNKTKLIFSVVSVVGAQVCISLSKCHFVRSVFLIWKKFFTTRKGILDRFQLMLDRIACDKPDINNSETMNCIVLLN